MSKQPVELLMDKGRVLYLRDKKGVEYRLDVFEGGGYYTALWPRTRKEIDDSIKQREEFEAKHRAEIEARNHQRKVSGIAKLIMFMQRRK